MSFCPYKYFTILNNKSCKRCSSNSCALEIPRTIFKVTEDSPTKYTATLDKPVFFKQLNISAAFIVASSSRILQSSAAQNPYCNVKIQDLENKKDYLVKLTSTFENNLMNCVAEFEFYKSFKNKELTFELDQSFYSGNNVITDESNSPVYVSAGVFDIKQFQR